MKRSFTGARGPLWGWGRGFLGNDKYLTGLDITSCQMPGHDDQAFDHKQWGYPLHKSCSTLINASQSYSIGVEQR